MNGDDQKSTNAAPRREPHAPSAPRSLITNVLLFRPGERFLTLPDKPHRGSDRSKA